jgi:hypothetical protein
MPWPGGRWGEAGNVIQLWPHDAGSRRDRAGARHAVHAGEEQSRQQSRQAVPAARRVLLGAREEPEGASPSGQPPVCCSPPAIQGLSDEIRWRSGARRCQSHHLRATADAGRHQQQLRQGKTPISDRSGGGSDGGGELPGVESGGHPPTYGMPTGGVHVQTLLASGGLAHATELTPAATELGTHYGLEMNPQSLGKPLCNIIYSVYFQMSIYVIGQVLYTDR